MTPAELKQQHPMKVFKHLLIFALGRLKEHGDEEAVEYVLSLLPAVEGKKDGY